MESIKVPLEVTGIGAIKKELRDLKSAIDAATDSEQVAKLSQRAGELKDRLADANEQVAIFASGSKFEQVNNGLGSIKDSIMSLDFAEAGDKAKMLTSALKGINPADFAAQFKGLGSIFMSLGSTIGILAKQFIAFGVSLLANPIFLLVAVITAIVAAVLIFLNKIGVLKKVLDVLMTPINALIQGFKDLTDWLGLTSFAAQENADKMSKANEQVVESANARQAAVVGGMDYEIKMAKIYGQETLDMELNKSKAIGKFSKEKLIAAERDLAAQKKLGDDADKDKIKKLKAQIAEEKATILDQRRERNLLVAQDRVDKQKEAEQDIKDTKEKNAKIRKANEDAAKKAAEDAKRFAENRLAAARLIKDLEIGLIENDNQREIDTIKEKYKRIQEDLIKNENLTAEERKRLSELYNQQLAVDLKKQEQTEIDANKAKQEKINAQIKANQEAQLQAEEDFQEQYRLQVMSAQGKEVDAVNTKYFQLIANAEKYGLDTKILKEQQEKEIDDINKKYADEAVKKEKEKNDKIRQSRLDAANAALNLAAMSSQAIQNVLDTQFMKEQQQLDAKNKAQLEGVQKGSDAEKKILKEQEKAKEQLAKKQFEANKKMQLAGAIIDAGKAITASLAAAPLAIGAVPNPIGIANLIATAAISATNIAKIAATQFQSSGGSSAEPSIPQAGSTSTTGQATPSFTLSGQNNNLNNVSAPQEPKTEITVKAVVSETELTNTQQKVAKINQNATL